MVTVAPIGSAVVIRKRCICTATGIVSVVGHSNPTGNTAQLTDITGTRHTGKPCHQNMEILSLNLATRSTHLSADSGEEANC